MGQYYKPCVLHTEGKKTRPRAWVYSHRIKSRYKHPDGTTYTIGSGLKLMEHSWLINSFVRTIERLLMPDGDWYKQPIVWAGDYADDEKDTIYNWMDKEGEIRESKGINLYDFCNDNNEVTKNLKRTVPKEFKYIVNHTTKQFVDKTKVPNKDGWRIHPLPLLTCEGNGRGLGDYCNQGEHTEQVGIWARHIISIEKDIPEGYTEFIFTLIE